MKNILYVENSFGNSYGYYHEILNGLAAAAGNNSKFFIFNDFTPESEKDLVYDLNILLDKLKSNEVEIDTVVFGFGWTNTGPHPPNNFLLEDKSIKKYVILNKEYSALDEKLEWIKKNNFDCAFTVHHDFKKYTKATGVKFHHLPFAANPLLFKDYNEGKNYEYDFGFTGIVRPEQTNNWREKVLLTLKDPSIWGNTRVYFSDHHHDRLEDYAKRICSSKIWFATTSPADLVSTRYYEVMMTGTTLLVCNRFDYLGLFEEDKHCVMFDTIEELSEKVKYYSNPKNEKERMKIVNSAKEHALKNHTWFNRGKKMIKILSGENR